MSSIIILASDTPHRRFFIKNLMSKFSNIEGVIFETESIKPSFPTGPFYECEERKFENDSFFIDFDDDLDKVQVHYVNTINSEQSISLINKISPSFAVIFGTRKISKKVTKLFEDGAINVHRGIASEYRGLDSNLWAIYHEDFNNLGVTIHKVNDVLDTGEIIYEEKLNVPFNSEIFQLRYYETLLATNLTMRAVEDYNLGRIVSYKQEKLGRYYSFMPLVLKETITKKFDVEYKN